MKIKQFVVICLILAILADAATIVVSWRLGWAVGYEQALNDNGISISEPNVIE